MTNDLSGSNQKKKNKVKRLFWLAIGVLFFAVIYFSPAWPDAVDPMGKILF